MEDDSEHLKKTVVDFRSGQVSMAVSRLNINGVANMSDPAVIEQMRRRNPYRKRRLPVTGEKKQCLDGLGGLKDDLKGLERSVAPRIGGLRNQYLVVLTEKMTQ